MRSRTAVVGLGSPFRGDDSIGLEVVRVLRARARWTDVEWIEAGPAGSVLLDLVQSFDRLVVVDCARMTAPPGTVRVFRPREVRSRTRHETFDAHEPDPLAIWDLGRSVGFESDLVFVGIEPHDLAEGGVMSPGVRHALPRAVEAVEGILENWSGEEVEHGSFGAAHSHR
jgi:hydrogenase maturation protease